MKRLPNTIDEGANQSGTIYEKFKKLFETNDTIKKTEVKTQMNVTKYNQENARPIPYLLQDRRRKKRIKQTNKMRIFRKTRNNRRKFFVSPVLITVKKEKLVKFAHDARKLNDIC